LRGGRRHRKGHHRFCGGSKSHRGRLGVAALKPEAPAAGAPETEDAGPRGAFMTVIPKYRRVLLKVSGEALMGTQAYGIDVSTVDRIASDVREAADVGAQICFVIGGGNIFRGLSGAAAGIDRATADYMGMLA